MAFSAAPASARAKKRILLVTTSLGFRHTSVPFAEKAIRAIAKESGEFSIVSTSDSPYFPKYPAPMDWELAGKARVGPDMAAMKGAMPPGAGVPPGAGPPSNAGPPPGMPWQGPGGAGSPQTREKVRKVLKQYLSAGRLSHYDAVIFVVTNGELPLPDKQAFLDWIKAGHGFIGVHSASDTLHSLPGYVDMLGGEFDHHGNQEVVKLEVNDPRNPMAEQYTPAMIVDEEWYLMKPGYDRGKVHSLVSMTEHPNEKLPGHYPVAWCKHYGRGRVFYSSQGHRPDIWDANWIGTDGKRTNSNEAVAAFRHSLLQAMRWSTGLIEANCQP